MVDVSNHRHVAHIARFVHKASNLVNGKVHLDNKYPMAQELTVKTNKGGWMDRATAQLTIFQLQGQTALACFKRIPKLEITLHELNGECAML